MLQEGKARILQAGNDVFYNKAQVTNRDLSILMIKQFIAKRQEEGAQGGKRASKRENKGANATAGGDAEAAAAGAAGPSGGAPTGADAAAADAHAAAAASTSGAAAASDAGSGKAGNAHGSKAAAGKAGVGGGGGGKKDKGIVVLEGLSATGLRALRYALEIDGIQRIDANDLVSAMLQLLPVTLLACFVAIVLTTLVHTSSVMLLQRSMPSSGYAFCFRNFENEVTATASLLFIAYHLFHDPLHTYVLFSLSSCCRTLLPPSPLSATSPSTARWPPPWCAPPAPTRAC